MHYPKQTGDAGTRLGEGSLGGEHIAVLAALLQTPPGKGGGAGVRYRRKKIKSI